MEAGDVAEDGVKAWAEGMEDEVEGAADTS